MVAYTTFFDRYVTYGEHTLSLSLSLSLVFGLSLRGGFTVVLANGNCSKMF